MSFMSQTIRTISAFVILLVLAACAQIGANDRLYLGEIVKVEDMPGDHYSPVKGWTQFTVLHILIVAKNADNRPAYLRVMVLGSYLPSKHGKAGDVVRFICPKSCLLKGEAWIEETKVYLISPR